MFNTVNLRPWVHHLMKISSTLVGRDKLIRLIQYLSRLRIWLLLNNKNSSQSNLEQWKKLVRHLNSTRKLLRVGRAPEYVQAAVNIFAIDNTNRFLQYLLSLRQLLLACYITLDNVTVLDSLGAFPWKSARGIQVEASRLWLGAIICGLVTQLYSLYKLKLLRNTKRVFNIEKILYFKNVFNTFQLLTTLFDLPIACSAGKVINFDDGVISICGTASSLVGIANIYKRS
ncbi:Peroxisomal membrane protein PMP30A [Fusarium oxysporum f. sp. phaseoli]